jgi:hypothetical protein
MIARNLIQGSLVPARATGSSRPLSETTHDLKNCMSILLYCVEMLDKERDAISKEDSIEDLKKITYRMNSLIEHLGSF